MSEFFDYFLNGLGLGAIFAFIALGYTMVYGIIKLINFAHGEFFMVGAFVGYFCLRDLNLEYLPLPHPLPIIIDFAVALLAAALAAAILAVITERIAYRPVRSAGRIAALLTAVGVSLLLQNLGIQLWGAGMRPYPDPKVPVAMAPSDGPLKYSLWVDTATTTDSGKVVEDVKQVASVGDTISAATISAWEAAGVERVYRRITISKTAYQWFVIALLVLFTPVLWWLVKRTRIGKAMRAVSEDADAAQLMGIPIDWVVAATFFLGALVAGIGGVAYMATYSVVYPLMGFLPGLKAFVAAVIGGIGSIPGAIVGGLVLGLAESIIPYALEQAGWSDAFAWKDAIAFTFLIVVLVVKPTGLFGAEVREKV